MNIFIDCEWNSYKGQLISMAMVADNNEEFYEVLHINSVDIWVAKNVIPVLNKEATNNLYFIKLFNEFLNKFDSINLIADWPEDIEHFCKLLIPEAGKRYNTPPLTIEIVPIDSFSLIPHNALEDARALKKAYYK